METFILYMSDGYVILYIICSVWVYEMAKNYIYFQDINNRIKKKIEKVKELVKNET